MKKYNISVNGKVYEVEVEEVGVSGAVGNTTKPKIVAAPKMSEPAPAKKQVARPAAQGSEIMQAPMPGTILDIKVNVGDTVKAGQVLLILEAMKMENEIVAPRDAEIVEININKGAIVSSGDALISLG